MTDIKTSDGSMTWMKAKYACPKRKGRYAGGPKAAPLKKRTKKGAKTYIYGSHVLVMLPSGKTVMQKAVA
jgi:hypothetical protein